MLLLLFIIVPFARDRPPKSVYFPAIDILIEGESINVVGQQIKLKFQENQIDYTYPVDITVGYTVKSKEDNMLQLVLPYIDIFDSEHKPKIYIQGDLIEYKIVPIYIADSFSSYYRAELGDNNDVYVYMLEKYNKYSDPVTIPYISEDMSEFYSAYDKNGLDSFYSNYLEHMSKRSSEEDLYSLRHLKKTSVGKIAVFDMALPANTEVNLVASYQSKCSFKDIFNLSDNTVFYFNYIFQNNFSNENNILIDVITPEKVKYLVSSNIAFNLVKEQHYQTETKLTDDNLELAVYHKNYMPDTFIGILYTIIRSPLFYILVIAIIGIIFLVSRKII